MRFLNTTPRNSRGLPCTVVLNAFSTGALTPEEAVSGAHRCGGIAGRGQTAKGSHLPASAQVTWTLQMRLDALGAYHVRCRAEADGVPAPRGRLSRGDNDEQTVNSPEVQ